MTSPSNPRDPRAFSLEGADVQVQPNPEDLNLPSDENLPVETAPRPRPRAGLRWGRMFIAATAALIALALTVAVSEFISSLLNSGGYIGWIALVLAGLAAFALFAVLIRETVGIARLTRLRRTREAAHASVLSDKAVRKIISDLTRTYANRPELGAARAELNKHDREVIDPPDRLDIAERVLMPGLDAEANRLIADATKRVSLVTALSPAAIIDLGVVLVTQLSLIRQIATIYGGRPGAIGLLRLARLVISHLAVTGSIAIGDDLIQQIIGHSLAARLSTRLGEGVFNGLMTARVGIAALALCRPLPFRAARQPRVTDFANFMRTTRAPGDKDQADR